MSEEEVKLSFETEEARAKAMDELPETPDNIEKLREIREAPIVAKPPEGGGEKPPEQPPEKPPEKPPEQQSDEYAGYKSLAEMRKAFDEQRGLIERQQGFIREKLSQPAEDPQTQKALERAEKAERELAELKAGSKQDGTESKQTKTDIANTQQALQEIDRLLTELEETGEKDPDLTLEPEYRKKERELYKLQRKYLGELTTLYVQAQDEVRAVKEESARVKSSAEEYLSTTKRNDLTRQQEEAKVRTIREMDDLAKDPEFKEYSVGKSYKDVEAEYVNYRNNIPIYSGFFCHLFD